MAERPESARPEIGLPLETVLQLHRSGPGDVARLVRLAVRGDWRSRTAALSALGRQLHHRPDLRRRAPLRQVIASRLPGRVRPPLSLRGLFVRDIVANALADRSWI